MKYYPLKFENIFKTTIWGGDKLKAEFGKTPAPAKTGESWEVSAVKNNVSIVANGPLKGKHLDELVKENPSAMLGEKNAARFGAEFPLLIKFIDAADSLSVQVHPDDKLAKARHNSFGKTEMWYILSAESGAKLISGFSKKITKEEYIERVKNNTIMEVMAEHPVKAGDAFFLPAGRVHAIGKGIVLAEVQQTSDITYRIYDFNRKGLDGKTRELHTEAAADANNYEDINCGPLTPKALDSASETVSDCNYFTVNHIKIDGVSERANNSFLIYIVLNGSVTITAGGTSESLQKGETVLVPAEAAGAVKLDGKAEVLEAYIKDVI